MADTVYDLLVIGGGPGGYVAALEAARRGLRTALAERDRLGGTCLNRGCIPTKAMFEAARRKIEIEEAAAFGLVSSPVKVNFAALMARKDRVVGGLAGGVENLMKAAGVRVIAGKVRRLAVDSDGAARLTVSLNKGTEAVGAGEAEVRARAVILATGARPVLPPIEGISLPGVITSDQAVALDRLPSSMAVIGGGVVGVELAGIFAALGTKVRIIEALPRILPGSDEELARRLAVFLRRRGVEIVTGVSVSRLEPSEEGEAIDVHFAAGTGAAASSSAGHAEVFRAEKVLVAVGRRPDYGGLALDEAGIRHSAAGIAVSSTGRTSREGIWAVGDATGGPQLAHFASAQALAAVSDILGQPETPGCSAVPACVFSFPELASVGLDETQARERGLNFRVGKFPFSASGRAQASGMSEGMVKILAGTDGQVLGMHILGPHASELIHIGAAAIKAGWGVTELERAVYLHPSLAEAVGEAARGVFGTPLHLAGGKR